MSGNDSARSQESNIAVTLSRSSLHRACSAERRDLLFPLPPDSSHSNLPQDAPCPADREVYIDRNRGFQMLQESVAFVRLSIEQELVHDDGNVLLLSQLARGLLQSTSHVSRLVGGRLSGPAHIPGRVPKA